MTTAPGADPPEPEVYEDRWEQIWAAGLPRGQRWDCAAPSPALVDLLQRGKVDVANKRVLVPGCGRGYDLPVFEAAGAREVVGLELSSTAADAAEAYLGEVVAAAEANDAAAAARLRQGMRIARGNFFDWADPNGPVFDVGFDYTFFCAMNPPSRPEWAKHWARLLAPGGGTLVALVFPIRPDADPNAGPPFPLHFALYEEMLGPLGFECTYRAPVPPELSHPARVNQEEMTVWTKR